MSYVYDLKTNEYVTMMFSVRDQFDRALALDDDAALVWSAESDGPCPITIEVLSEDDTRFIKITATGAAGEAIIYARGGTVNGTEVLGEVHVLVRDPADSIPVSTSINAIEEPTPMIAASKLYHYRPAGSG